jgi:hypothetical protein
MIQLGKIFCLLEVSRESAWRISEKKVGQFLQTYTEYEDIFILSDALGDILLFDSMYFWTVTHFDSCASK